VELGSLDEVKLGSLDELELGSLDEVELGLLDEASQDSISLRLLKLSGKSTYTLTLEMVSLQNSKGL
jgi:hypothetical protein